MDEMSDREMDRAQADALELVKAVGGGDSKRLIDLTNQAASKPEAIIVSLAVLARSWAALTAEQVGVSVDEWLEDYTFAGLVSGLREQDEPDE